MTRFPKFFSTDSAKAIKAEKYGWLNAINYMAPHTTGGAGNLCPDSSAGCRALCLGMYSGQAAMVADLENGTNAVRQSRIAKAQFFMTERLSFMAEMEQHIRAMIRKADRESKKLAVRPNGSTDIAFEYIRGYNGQTLPQQFPEIQFVDYTKSMKRMLEAMHVLANRKNVAVVFGHGQPETFMGHRVIDGTEHDLRHLDKQPVIVGLDPKGKKAKADTSGFVVHDYGAGC